MVLKFIYLSYFQRYFNFKNIFNLSCPPGRRFALLCSSISLYLLQLWSACHQKKMISMKPPIFSRSRNLRCFYQYRDAHIKPKAEQHTQPSSINLRLYTFEISFILFSSRSNSKKVSNICGNDQHGIILKASR